MRHWFSTAASMMGAMASMAAANVQAQVATTPHLERRGRATQLIVDGKPYLVLGGELRNSSSSDLAYMAPVWPRLKAMNLNTVLAPVSWETIEPREGQFDFSNVDGLLKGARAQNLRLVLLWFGTWKNTYSSYVPGWVKRDQARFARAQTSDGHGTDRLSPFSTTTRDADARAFTALMRHLRAVDGAQHTVLMVQVENEVGMIPEARPFARRRSRAGRACARTAAPLSGRASHDAPPDVAHRLGGGGRADRRDMARGVRRRRFDRLAVHVMGLCDLHRRRHRGGEGAISAADMFTNAALIRPNYEPGQYNSGGPLPFAIDVYKAGAPSLDLLAPDIYFEDYANWASQYARVDNPLFVPEARGGMVGAANALYSIGALNAVGFSPFGIDGEGVVLQGDASIGLSAAGEGDPAMTALYGQLARIAPLILEKQAEGGISTVLIEGGAQRAGRGRIGDYIVNMSRAGGAKGDVDQTSRIAAMFLQTGADEFVVVGSGDAQLSFATDRPGAPIVGVESIDEQFLRDGRMVAGRRLNGDETGQGQSLRLFAKDAGDSKVYRIRLYRYR